MKDDQFLNRAVRLAGEELGRRVDFIRGYVQVPVGKMRLTPTQFKQKYGISVRDAEYISKRYGPEVTQEVLNALEGNHIGGDGNAPSTRP